jgi:chromosome segregation ATPase
LKYFPKPTCTKLSFIGKHSEAEKALQSLLQDAEKDRDVVREEMERIRKDLIQSRSSNEDHRTKSDNTAKNVARLRETVAQLDADMSSLRAVNAEDIRRLQEQREQNDKMVADLRFKLSDTDHEHNNLKILIEKTKHEITNLGSEKEKHQSQNYQKRIDDFLKNISDSESKTEYLRTYLEKITLEWSNRLVRVTKDTESTIRSNEHEEHVKKLDRLLHELGLKNQELEALEARRATIIKEVGNEDSSLKDGNNHKARQELDAINNQLLAVLKEKNQMYDDLLSNTGELLDIDGTILANSHEIARLTQEFGILRKELEQKEKIIYDLKIILEERKREIAELKQLIEELKATLKERDAEAERLRQLAREKEARIKELEKQLESMRVKPPTPPPAVVKPVVDTGLEITDDVDAMLAQYLNGVHCPVPIKRLGGGFYMFGTKKIYAKIMHGKLVIRVGGGYMGIEEFIKTYAEAELLKVNARREKGLDIFTGKAVGDADELNNSIRSPKGRKSAKGARGSAKKDGNIEGTDVPTELTAEDIKHYKSQ